MTSSSSNAAEASVTDAISAGRKHYEAKQYKRALEQFTRVMRLCACARGMKRDRCSCKEFEKVAEEGGSIFKEAMYTCRCDVGQTFNKCDNPQHIQALDYRAAAFEALEALDRAKRDAEWILELAPRLPDGYLRLGKIARLQKKHEYAWKIYTAGIEINKDTASSSSRKIQQLYDARRPLHRHFAKKDPLTLPAEIVQLILSYLEFVELPPCLGVCKLWRRTLTSPWYDRLWRSMAFPDRNMKRAPRVDVLKKLLTWAGKGGARKIVIRNPKGLLLNQAKLLMLLKSSTQLQYLEVGPQSEPLSFPSHAPVWKSLQHVAIDGTGPASKQNWNLSQDTAGGFPLGFLNNASSSLEHLVLTGVPDNWYMGHNLPSLPNLKSLRLSVGATNDISLPIFFLSDAFPSLEQLWIGSGILNLDSNALHGWADKWDTIWTNLKVFIYERPHLTGPAHQVMNTLFTLRDLTCLNRGNTLKHIQLEIPSDAEGPRGGQRIFYDPENWPASLLTPQFKDLQTVRFKDLALSPQIAHGVASESLQLGKLHHFDIVFPSESLRDRIGDKSATHLKGYEWLRSADSIRSIGCYRFRFRSYPRNDEDLPLPSFLASFDNLETLSLDSEHYEEAEFATVVGAILKVTHLKTIYTTSVKGAMMDQVRKLAETQGVRLIWGRQPQPWPVPLDE